MSFGRNFTISRLGFSIDLLNRTNRRNDFIDWNPKRPKLCGKLLMFVGRQAALFCGLDEVVAVVQSVRPAGYQRESFAGKTAHHLTLERPRFNPFTLELSVHDLRLAEGAEPIRYHSMLNRSPVSVPVTFTPGPRAGGP